MALAALGRAAWPEAGCDHQGAGTERRCVCRDAPILAEGDVLLGKVHLVTKWTWLIVEEQVLTASTLGRVVLASF